jgi:DNA mismatch endonuclease (patch repair protein)
MTHRCVSDVQDSASFASSPGVRERMQRHPRANTKPELALRRELHQRGLRFRISARPLPSVRRRVDIVFPRIRLAIEIRGCFWHHCPEHGRIPKSNTEWWSRKFARTRARDQDTEARLLDSGWRLLIVWEHDDVADAADRIEAAVLARRADVKSASRTALAPSSRPPEVVYPLFSV